MKVVKKVSEFSLKALIAKNKKGLSLLGLVFMVSNVFGQNNDATANKLKEVAEWTLTIVQWPVVIWAVWSGVSAAMAYSKSGDEGKEKLKNFLIGLAIVLIIRMLLDDWFGLFGWDDVDIQNL
jgi:hypothetical protein